MKKSSEEIREAFDKIAQYYAESAIKGESEPTIIDSAIMAEIIVQISHKVYPNAKNVLDIGCGGGLYSLKIARLVSDINIDLHDFSKPMLQGAYDNLSKYCKANSLSCITKCF